MKICLLTYDTAHKKTSQVYINLINSGFSGIDLMLMPFKERPTRKVAFVHRPYQFEGGDPRALAQFGGGTVLPYADWSQVVGTYDYFLICGSNLIEPEFARCGRIINAHAGLIPISRGLDSFKWAIMKRIPIGNTLHLIDEAADAGEIICRMRTPLFMGDDIGTFAERHYQNEIWMLSNFDRLIGSKSAADATEAPSEPTKRMPFDKETEMLKSFEDYKSEFAVADTA